MNQLKLKMKEHELMEDNGEFNISQDERTLATIAHLGPFIGIMVPGMGNILVPFLIWFLKKDESEYLEEHAKEALNFQITITILMIGAAITMLLLVGFLILPLLILLDVAFSITAAVRANRGEDYEYPLNFNLIK